MKSWATLRELVSASIPERLRALQTVDTIMDDVLHHRAQIWEVCDTEGRLCGVAVTRIEQEYLGRCVLRIVSFLLYDRLNDEALRAGWAAIGEWARGQGATVCGTYAEHPLIADYLKTLGFQLYTYAEVAL